MININEGDVDMFEELKQSLTKRPGIYKRGKRYEIVYRIDYVFYRFGSYESEEEAIKVYDQVKSLTRDQQKELGSLRKRKKI